MSDDQTFQFEKFMQSIEKKESMSPKQNDDLDEKTYQRRHAELYRELPQNRIRYEKNSS